MDQIISNNKTLINTNNAQYTFTIIDGKVTAVTEHIGNTSIPLPILPSDSYILDGKDVVYNSGDNFGTVSVRYTDSDGDGRFKVGSIDIADELPEGALHDESNLDFSNFLKVHNGEPANGEPGKDLFHINEGGDLSIRDFNSSEGDLLVFDANLGISSREELQNLVTEISYNAQDLAVDFGSENSITLVGIQPDLISWNDVVILG